MSKLSEAIHKGNTFLDSKIGRKSTTENPFVKELPDFIQILSIHLHSGCTIETALKYILEANVGNHNYEELRMYFHKYHNGNIAINYLAQSANHRQMWRLTRIINQYKVTGSKSSLSSLESFYNQLWDEQISLYKNKFDRLSVMMTFITMLSFVSVIVIVAAPIAFIL